MRELTCDSSRAWAGPSSLGHLTVLATTVALLATGCTGGEPTPEPSPATPQPRRGGEVVFGTDSVFECLNPITDCSAFPWTRYAILQQILPRAMEIDPKGNYVASPLLTVAPSLANGLLRSGPPFTVTFRLREEAVWEDGSAITSEDFRFTWKAIVNTRRAYYPEDYEEIDSIDATDLRTVVITLNEVIAEWPELFGGELGFVLKRAAFPTFAQDRTPNLGREMVDDIPFSGGPFILDQWNVGAAALVRNDRYFGQQPYLDRVTFIYVDPESQGDALMKGRVAAIHPSPWEKESLVAKLRSEPSLAVRTAPGTFVEILLLDLRGWPTKDPLVRQAFLYAMDRQALVEDIARPFDANAEVVNCGFGALPHLGPWCTARPFESFGYDPERARTLLEEAGFECSSSPCVQNGRPLVVKFPVNSSTERRNRGFEILAPKALAAGFQLQILHTQSSPDFPYTDPRAWDVTFSSAGGSLDPGVTEDLACDQFPEDTGFRGHNLTHWCNPEATRLMKASDREPDADKRLELLSRVYELEAQDAIFLPLYVWPTISAWRSDRIAGPIGMHSGSPHGLFFNMNEWYVPA